MSLSKPIYNFLGFYFQQLHTNPIRTKSITRLVITYTANLKFLGMYITENLSWASHFHYLIQKLNKAIYLIKSQRDLVSLPILRSVYFAKFESLLKYGIIFWGCGQKDMQTVFKIKKKCLKTDQKSQ
jgi:hypothetical protein